MSKSKEPTLPGLAIPKMEEAISLKPKSDHTEPSVWVKRLAVFADWPPSSETLLRKIELRRGLNILWAKPSGAKGETSRLGGHGAGKTTFCRLLRYVLDDGNSGTLAFRNAFNDKYQNGWVLAEVFLAGKCWLVGRPLGRHGQSAFAKEGGSLDDTHPQAPSRTGYEDYQAALDAAVFGDQKLRTLSGTGRRLDWSCLHQWLSRDQEAHYGGLLEWRHKDSDSQCPDLAYPDRENLVRVMLGLVEDDEQGLLRQHAQKAEEHEDGVRNRPKFEYVVEREKKRLESLIGHPVAGPEDILLQQEVTRQVKDLRKQADAAVTSAKQDEELDRLASVVSDRETEWKIARAIVDEMEDTIAMEEGRLQGARKQASDSAQRLSLRSLQPFAGYCSQPLNRAWRSNCPLADDRPTEDQVEHGLKKAQTEAERRAELLARQKGLLKQQQKIAGTKETALQTARRALNEARERRNKSLQKLNEPNRQAADLDAAFNGYRDACHELDKLKKALVRLDKEKRKLDGQLDEMAKRHKRVVEAFGRIFDHFAQAMLGPAVKGSVEFSGKGIEPRLDYHGPRDSAALKLTKLLAFDLAALTLGMTSTSAHHPRFLVHDSPREADLAVEIYRELFMVAQKLEVECGTEAGFQYIITTTEPPPPIVNREPWTLQPPLRRDLRAAPPRVKRVVRPFDL